MHVIKNISIKPYNTFGVDVTAKYFAEPTSVEELKSLLVDKKYSSEEKIIIGGGSNLLLTKPFNGIIIKLANKELAIIEEDEDSVIIKVDAGVVWDDFVMYAVDNKFYGIENLSLIPGNVGASPIQNIGAYGAEVRTTIKKVNVLSLENLEERSFNNNECKFGYRDSIFKHNYKDKVVITSVEYELSKKHNLNLSYEPLKKMFATKKEIEIKEVRNEIISIRKSKLPDTKVLGNGGSFFKNPIIPNPIFQKLKNEYPELKGYKESDTEVKISAGWLIQQCELKGFRLGNVGVHKNQALVIVNYGGASGKEILDFSEIIKEKVSKKFGIKLETEINIY